MGQNRIDKTNAARLLERAGIRYELIPYRVGKEHLSAAQVAGQLGEPVGRVFKTLVLRGDRRSEDRRVGKECRSRWSPYH